MPVVDKQMLDRFLIDHEVGHCLAALAQIKTPSGLNDDNFNEALADSYAVLRHMQFYGAGSTFPEVWAMLRSMSGPSSGNFGHYVKSRRAGSGARGTRAGQQSDHDDGN